MLGGFVISMVLDLIGWRWGGHWVLPFGMNRGAISRYATEMMENSGTKIRKLTCDGEAVRVSLLYQ